MTQAIPPRQDTDRPAGQVRHDSSGRAVWEWAAATGRHALDSTSRLLKRLDMPGLTLEGDDSAPPPTKDTTGKGPPAGDVPDLPPPGQRGFNPYDRKLPARGATPNRAAPAAKRPVPSAAPAARPGLIGRLFGRKP